MSQKRRGIFSPQNLPQADPSHSGLMLTLGEHESVVIGDHIMVVQLIQIRGKRARIRFNCDPQEFSILRQKLFDEVKALDEDDE